MKVTPELLKRYYNGEANELEKIWVEDWLNHKQNQEQIPFPTHIDEQAVRTSMWEDIEAYKQGSISRPYQWKYLYGMTACLVILVAGYLVLTASTLFSRTLLIKNDYAYGEQHYTIQDINLTVAANSQCEIEVPVFGDVEEVRFQGAVSITNSSGDQKILNIKTDYKRCPQKPAEQVKLKKGGTYLVLLNQKCQVISATLDEIRDGIPRNFSTPLLQKFNLSI